MTGIDPRQLLQIGKELPIPVEDDSTLKLRNFPRRSHSVFRRGIHTIPNLAIDFTLPDQRGPIAFSWDC